MGEQIYCRLCVDIDDNAIEIFGEEGKRLNIEQIVALHFTLDLKESDEYSNVICKSCWSCVDIFHEFYENIQLAQSKLFSCKQDVKNDHDYEEEEPIYQDEEDTIASVDIHQSLERLQIEKLDDFEQYDDAKAEYVEIENVYEDEIYIEDDCLLNSVIEEYEIVENLTNIDTFDHNISKVADTPKVYDAPKKRTPKYNQIPTIDRPIRTKVETPSERAERDRQILEFFQLVCTMCPETTETFYELRAHYRKVHNVKRGFITCCNRKLYDRSEILEHLAWHKNPEDFRCKLCDRVFSDTYNLNVHNLEAHEPDENKRYECDICGYRYGTFARLTTHMVAVHVAKYRKNFKCDQCDKGFVYPSLLRQHQNRVHNSSYFNICEICGKSQKNNKCCRELRNFPSRKRISRPVRLMECGVCGEKLKTKVTLRGHILRYHTSDTNVTCKLCGKVSANSEALLNHIQYMHVQKKSHQCPMCTKTFKLRKQLKEHVMRHKGIAMFACKYCPKTFNSSGNKYSHQKKKHYAQWLGNRDRRVTLKEKLKNEQSFLDALV